MGIKSHETVPFTISPFTKNSTSVNKSDESIVLLNFDINITLNNNRWLIKRIKIWLEKMATAELAAYSSGAYTVVA